MKLIPADKQSYKFRVLTSFPAHFHIFKSKVTETALALPKLPRASLHAEKSLSENAENARKWLVGSPSMNLYLRIFVSVSAWVVCVWVSSPRCNSFRLRRVSGWTIETLITACGFCVSLVTSWASERTLHNEFINRSTTIGSSKSQVMHQQLDPPIPPSPCLSPFLSLSDLGMQIARGIFNASWQRRLHRISAQPDDVCQPRWATLFSTNCRFIHLNAMNEWTVEAAAAVEAATAAAATTQMLWVWHQRRFRS